MDASNSVRDRFKFEQEAAIEFLNQTVRPRYDRAFIVGFDVTPEVTQDFTDNTESLSRGVRGLRPGGGTAMYDALYFACRDKLLKAPHTGPVRKAVILLSDGEDNQSRVTREEVAALAGLAPYDNDSCSQISARHIKGGRKRLRGRLYSAALPASFRWNAQLIALYQRLIAKGKSHKTALIACARKLLIFVNAVIARGEPWTEKPIRPVHVKAT